MQTDTFKSNLQGFFADGLVTVIGLGHSAAYGLPAMPALAGGLGERMPTMIDDQQAEDWEKVRASLDDGQHLEDALVSVDHESPLIEVIVEASAEIIGAAEAVAIKRLIRDGARFPLAELVPHLAPNDRATVVATNYDRLAEVAIECAGYFLDCGFVGMHRGRADAGLSRTSLRSSAVPRKRGFSVRYQPHIRLAKPHGSLDWYLCDGVPIRSPFALELPRLMITPGASKFRKGYERPFDHHREIANHAIDAATRFLAIGFGFNDPHLQTHLAERIEAARAERAQLPGIGHDACAKAAVAEHVLSERERAAATDARLSPPAYIKSELGERPSDPTKAAAWDRAVRGVESFRVRNGVVDRHNALGPEPKDRAAQARQRQARERLQRTQRQLGLKKQRTAERSMRLGIGR